MQKEGANEANNGWGPEPARSAVSGHNRPRRFSPIGDVYLWVAFHLSQASLIILYPLPVGRIGLCLSRLRQLPAPRDALFFCRIEYRYS
jgi:hypothetical protein